MAGTDAAVVVTELSKIYGPVRAVDQLSFSVQRGEIFALLGPNGAGKTTTIEILEGYRGADAGTVQVLGLEPRRQRRQLQLRIGVMLQADGVQPMLTPREVLQLYAGFFPQPRDPEQLLAEVGLQNAASTRCRRLSGGQKRRLALALALVGRPELLFLDEPTAGMDPQARLATWHMVQALRQEGTTVILTTHLLDEAERLADRVAIIDHGRLVTSGTPHELLGGQGQGVVQLVAAPGLPLAPLTALPGVQAVTESATGQYTLQVAPEMLPAVLVDLTAVLRDQGVTLRELRVGERSLEDLFLQLTGSEERL